MASNEIVDRPAAAYFDSEGYNILRQIDPGLMDSADFEARLRRRLAKRKWVRDNAREALRGPGDGQNVPLGPQLTGPVPRAMIRRGGLDPAEGGAAVPPNFAGGFGFGALLPMIPSLIGGLASAIPSIIGLFKRGKGAVAPPNLRRGGAVSADVMRFLAPVAERIEERTRGATSGADFFSRLAEGIREEVPPLLHKTTGIAPRGVDFITSRVLKRMGLPESFVKFAAEEARRITEKGAPYIEGRLAKRISGSGTREVKGGLIKELVSPIVKYVASKALHGVKPARQFYNKAKQIMGTLDDVYKYTEPKGSGKAPLAADVPEEGADEEESVMAQPEHKRNLFSRIGKLARKVLGKTVEAVAKPGSRALGAAVDAAAERVLGTTSTLGRSLAESIGESALGSIGKAMQEDEEEGVDGAEEGEEATAASARVRAKPKPKAKAKAPPVATTRKRRAARAPPAPAPAPAPMRRGRSTGAGAKKKGALVIRVL